MKTIRLFACIVLSAMLFGCSDKKGAEDKTNAFSDILALPYKPEYPSAKPVEKMPEVFPLLVGPKIIATMGEQKILVLYKNPSMVCLQAGANGMFSLQVKNFDCWSMKEATLEIKKLIKGYNKTGAIVTLKEPIVIGSFNDNFMITTFYKGLSVVCVEYGPDGKLNDPSVAFSCWALSKAPDDIQGAVKRYFTPAKKSKK